MEIVRAGGYTVIPWIVATITDVVVGGWLVDHLIAQGFDAAKVRKTLLTIGMTMGLAVIGAAFTRNPNVAITWLSIALGGLAFAAPIFWSLPGLVAPKEMVGTVGALMNFANNIMGIIAPIATGYISTKTGSFAVAFGVAGVVLFVGLLSFVTLLGRIEPIPSIQAPS
jgi:ACS family D-galactonate transporter-like MFS transporter